MRKITFGLMLILMGSGAVQADTLPRPTAAYDGSARITSGSDRFNATVNAVGPRQRWTASMQGTPQTVLIDLDTGKVALLVPALQTAMTIDTVALGGFDLHQLETMPVRTEGREPVNGIDCIGNYILD